MPRSSPGPISSHPSGFSSGVTTSRKGPSPVPSTPLSITSLTNLDYPLLLSPLSVCEALKHDLFTFVSPASHILPVTHIAPVLPPNLPGQKPWTHPQLLSHGTTSLASPGLLLIHQNLVSLPACMLPSGLHLWAHPSFFVFLINLFYLFYFWLRWVFVAVRGLSLVVE